MRLYGGMWLIKIVILCEVICATSGTAAPQIGTTAVPVPYHGQVPEMRTARQEKDALIQECKFDRAGTAYMGIVANTISGAICQRWDEQSPRPHPYTNPSQFPDESLSDAGNQCRNPGNHSLGPWCYTTSGDLIWEYCDIPICHCKTSRRGAGYLGNMHVTVSGKPCQSWLDQSPHQHTYYSATMFPDHTLTDARNYCRNPGGEHPGGPWCFTHDHATRWQYCHVPYCECSPDTAGQGYAGTVSVTMSGLTCQRWDDTSVHFHNYNKNDAAFIDGSANAADNYCRNPDMSDTLGPWCYTMDPDVRWQYCSVPSCEIKIEPEKIETTEPGAKECLLSDKGTEYRGFVSVTVQGYICQPWNSQTPHPHSFSPEGAPALEDAGNSCRNPGGGRDRPWCYTMDDAVEWDYCNIPKCGCKTEMHGRNYTGDLSMTRSGRVCQAWSAQSPHQHSYTQDEYFPDASLTAAGRRCRNPDDREPWGPWCFTTDPDVRWEYCDVPACDCQVSTRGEEYHGHVSMTTDGHTCQSWSEQSPHTHSLTDSANFPDQSIEEAGNHCRNPKGYGGERPWCYTTDPDTRWAYCDIPHCDGGHSSTLPPPLPPPTECLDSVSGKNYRGSVATTRHGRPCQRWTVQTPHRHRYTHTQFYPDDFLEDAANFCRNPDDSGQTFAVWCYTTDPGVRWEFCDVPYCEGVNQPTPAESTVTASTDQPDGQIYSQDCRQEKLGWSYVGDVSVTVSGRQCQRWDVQSPHVHPHLDDASYPDVTMVTAGNQCRNPGRWRPGGPWCYTTDPAVEWEYCQVDYCECLTSREGSQYGGRQSITRAGFTCQRWDAQSPHSHRYYDDNSFPDGSVEAASNYCRNPDPTSSEDPWCYTDDPEVRWDFCLIPLCGEVKEPMVTPTPSIDERLLGKLKDSEPLGSGEIAAIILGLLLFVVIVAAAIFLFRHKSLIAKTIKAQRYQSTSEASLDVGLTFYNNGLRPDQVSTITMDTVSMDTSKPELIQESILKMCPKETLENPIGAASLDNKTPVTVL